MRIKRINIIFFSLFLVPLTINFGCRQPKPSTNNAPIPENDIEMLSSYAHYTPVKIDIMPLTEFIDAGGSQRPKINLYVRLLDQFGSQIKSPGMFRFELYEYIQRSAEPKGKRAIIWPDIDLTDPIKNNEYWRDFLRTYVFSLPCKQSINQDYILQVTCLCPNGKRLSTEFMLRQIK